MKTTFHALAALAAALLMTAAPGVPQSAPEAEPPQGQETERSPELGDSEAVANEDMMEEEGEPPLPPEEDTGPWTLVQHDGRDWVTARQIAEFYRFDRYSEEDFFVWFRSPTLAMRLEIESNVARINNTRYLLSQPALRRDGEILVSRVDLVKVIDPCLRPSYISSLRDFDTVVVDPGHGGADPGTRGPHGPEKLFALDVGLRLRDELVRRGLKVVLTREGDTLPTKYERADVANAAESSIFLSLHFNRSRSGAVQGLETYAMTPQGEKSTNDRRPDGAVQYSFRGNLNDAASLALATAVHAEILRQCHTEDRGIRRARWAVLKEARRPGILIEGGYLSSPAEAARINSPSYRARMAAAIADGVMNFKRALGPH